MKHWDDLLSPHSVYSCNTDLKSQCVVFVNYQHPTQCCCPSEKTHCAWHFDSPNISLAIVPTPIKQSCDNQATTNIALNPYMSGLAHGVLRIVVPLCCS